MPVALELPPTNQFTAVSDGYEFPVRVMNTENKGRCFIAARDIAQGELVLECLPYLAIPDSDHRQNQVCSRCIQFIPTSKLDSLSQKSVNHSCNDCQEVVYCSPQCQLKDSRMHKLECDFIRQWLKDVRQNEEWTPYMVDYCWLLMRCLLRRCFELSDEHPGFPDQLYFQDVWRLCANREAFPTERKQEFERCALIVDAFMQHLVREKAVEESHALTQDELYELICKEECNSFGLYHYRDATRPRQSYGLAIYPTAVYFNHSCDPNLVHLTEGTSECFFSLRPIQQGEELTITYINLRQPTSKRVKELQTIFLFTCTCHRCLSGEEDDVTVAAHLKERLCQKAGCFGTYLPHNERMGGYGRRFQDEAAYLQWKCESCGTERS